MSQIVLKNKTYIEAVEKYPLLLIEVSDQLKTQEICNKAVRIEPTLLVFVPDCFKTREMCNEAVRNWPWPSFFPDHLRTRETCIEVMQALPKAFTWMCAHLKTQDMCKNPLETG